MGTYGAQNQWACIYTGYSPMVVRSEARVAIVECLSELEDARPSSVVVEAMNEHEGRGESNQSTPERKIVNQ